MKALVLITIRKNCKLSSVLGLHLHCSNVKHAIKCLLSRKFILTSLKKCMNLFLDNFNFRHIEKMKLYGKEFSDEMAAAAQAEAEAMAGQPNPEQMKNEYCDRTIDVDAEVERMKVGQKDMQMKLDNLVKMRELDMEQQKHQVELLKALTEISVNKADKDATHLERAIELSLQTAQANQVENEEAEEKIEEEIEKNV